MITEETAVSVDLSSCDREPIHIPGAIQPHGALLAVALPDLTVTQVSANLGVLLGVDAKGALSRPLADVLGQDLDREVRGALEREPWDANPFRLTLNGQHLDGIVHRHQGVVIVELEPAGEPQSGTARHHLQVPLTNLQSAHTLPDLCRSVAQEVRRLTGFERVMIYRFDQDGHGSVVAETKDAALQPYLGLHYPASDIPRQARELYLKNWLRIIPDARYTAVPLIPCDRPDTGKPLDLSFAVLRSVSPIHLEYLANIGFRASMSISLIVRDRLWGLISCAHHSGPRTVPYEIRSACEVLGRLASLQIAALEDREAATERSLRRDSLEMLASAMRSGDHVLEALLTRADMLMTLVGAHGAAVVRGENVAACGQTPPAPFLLAVTDWLDTRGDSTPFATSSLSATFSDALEVTDVASGLLSFALPGRARARVLWFRPEVVQTVSWGGDPRKPVDTDGGTRLHPRRSFELWKEEIRRQSKPWIPSDVEAAEDLRRDAVEIDLERQVVRAQQAVRARDDLVAVVSHDLKNPLGVIQMQASLLEQLVSAAEREPSRRIRAGIGRIRRSVDRMNALIHDLLDLAKVEAGRFVVQLQPEDPREMVEEALLLLRPLAQAKRIRLSDEVHECPAICADRERIYQIFSNLVGNAIKFTPEGGSIVVGARRDGQDLLFTVADTGPGLDAEQLAHVFDRYWQARRSDHEGSGLGLFIAKGIAEAHGGRMWVEAPPTGGAHFKFTIPLA